MVAGKTIFYTLPAFFDANPSDTPFISSYTSHSWLTLSGSTFTISPLVTDSYTTYTITVSISDGFQQNSGSFDVIVLPPNIPPKFSAALIPQSITAGVMTTYALPATYDADGDTVSVFVTYLGGALPTWVTLSGSGTT